MTRISRAVVMESKRFSSPISFSFCNIYFHRLLGAGSFLFSPVLICDASISIKEAYALAPGEGGEVLPEKLCFPLPKTLTLFMTNIGDIPYPIYDMINNSELEKKTLFLTS